jgi:ABC-2 type transport system permease protein
MRLYFEIARQAFRRATAYRSAYIAGLLTNAFFGALRCFVFIALYGAGGSVAGLTLQDTISYTWVTQSLISIGAGWIDSRDLMGTIRTGDVVADLMRPWNFYGYWLSRSLGERVFNLLVRASLTYLIGVLYFRAYVPSPGEALAFAAAIGLAMLVSFAFSFLVNLTAFWLIDNSGVLLIANVVLQFFSGFLLPLAFFPAPLAALARLLPFQAITGLPAQVFLGQITGAALVETLLLQAFWALALGGLAALALRAALHKVVIQGG